MMDAIYDVKLQSADPYRPGTIRVLAHDAVGALNAAQIRPGEVVLEIVEVARL